MLNEEHVRERIEELKAERDQFVQQANQQLAALNGAIQALEELLRPDVEGAQHGDTAE